MSHEAYTNISGDRNKNGYAMQHFLQRRCRPWWIRIIYMIPVVFVLSSGTHECLGSSGDACILLDKSGSMLGFYAAEREDQDKSPFQQYIERDLYDFLNDTMGIRTDTAFFSHGENTRDILVTKDIHVPISLTRFGQTSQLDDGLKAAMDKGYKLIVLISDNVQEDVKATHAVMGDLKRLYRHFQSDDVSQIHLVPLAHPFDGKIYLPSYQFRDMSNAEIRERLRSGSMTIERVEKRERYVHVACRGPRGLMMYVVSMDPKYDHLARRIAEKAARSANSPAIKTYPLNTVKLDIEMSGDKNFNGQMATPSSDGIFVMEGRVNSIEDGDDSDSKDDYESVFYVKFINSFDHLKLNSTNPAGQKAAITVHPLDKWKTIGFENFSVQPSIHPPTLVEEIIGPDGKTQNVYRIKVRISSDQFKLRLWPISEFLHVVFSDEGSVSGGLHLDLTLPAHFFQVSDDVTADYFTRDLKEIDKILNTEDLVQFLTDRQSVIGTDIIFEDIKIKYPMAPTVIFIIILIVILAILVLIIRYIFRGDIELTARIMKNDDPSTEAVYSFVLRRYKHKKNLDDIITIKYLNPEEVRIVAAENVNVVGGIDLSLPVDFSEQSEVDMRLIRNDEDVYNIELISHVHGSDDAKYNGTTDTGKISVTDDIFEDDSTGWDDDDTY